MKKMGTFSPGLGVDETALKMPAAPIGLTPSGRVQEDGLALGDACTANEGGAAVEPAEVEGGGALGGTAAGTLATTLLLAGLAGVGAAAAAPHAASRTHSAAGSSSLPAFRL